MKKFVTVLIALLLIACVFSSGVSAAAPYDTYTYSYAGNVQISPAAYEPQNKTAEFGEIGSLQSPNDLFYDEERERIFIADTGNVSKAVAALAVFGYSAADVTPILSRLDPSMTVEEMITATLRQMA